MKKNKRKRIVSVILAGLLMSAPVPGMYMTAYGTAQVSSVNDSKLSDLGIAPGTISPGFSSDVLEYTAEVASDVTEISVRAIPRAAGGTIASVEGARSLQPGTNTVTVTCSAQDNSYTVYTITVTRGDAAQDQQAARNEDQADDPADASASKDGTEKAGQDGLSSLMGKVASDGTVKLNHASYQLSSNFSYGAIAQDIPSAFGQGSVEIGGSSYSTLYCEANGVNLVYMENTDGSGSTGFYYYDEKQNAVERFKYTGIGENFVIFISTAREELPAGYQETTLTLPSGKEVVSYQNTAQNTASETMEDYYLIYGINSDGSNGWYWYDNAQGTYMRYVQMAEPAKETEKNEETPVERTVSMKKYNLLNEKYTKIKSSMVKIVSILVIGLLLLLIIFTAMLFRSRDSEENGPGKEERSRVKKHAKAKKQEQAVSKSSLAAGRSFGSRSEKGNSKKVTKTFSKEPAEKEPVPQTVSMQMPADIQEQVRGQAGHPQNGNQTQGRSQTAYEQHAREQAAYEQRMREQAAYEQRMREQAAYEQRIRKQEQADQERAESSKPKRGLLKKEKTAVSQDSVQLAAEKMRQSVRRGRTVPQAAMQDDYERPAAKSQAEAGAQEQQGVRDPMDEWEVEETAVRRKPRRKKRSLSDEDMEIMDLNDL